MGRLSGGCRECGVGCGGGVLSCIQALDVLGQASVHHTYTCMHKPAYVPKYVYEPKYIYICTYTTHTIRKYNITIVGRVNIKTVSTVYYHNCSSIKLSICYIVITV